MAATYYRSFFPEDMDGTVPHVAPSKPDRENTAPCDEFLARVGTEECRDDVRATEREALGRRGEMFELHTDWVEETGAAFDIIG